MPANAEAELQNISRAQRYPEIREAHFACSRKVSGYPSSLRSALVARSRNRSTRNTPTIRTILDILNAALQPINVSWSLYQVTGVLSNASKVRILQISTQLGSRVKTSEFSKLRNRCKLQRTEVPIYSPRSPRPRMRPPSVTTMIWTLWEGQLSQISR